MERKSHDELSHREETESRSRDQIAANFRAIEKGSRTTLLLPLLPLPQVNRQNEPTAGLIPDPGYQSGGCVLY
jgi:hypothetical protein